jgi:hypothetical protein
LCRFHHRLKTFAPGWTIAIDPDGTLHVTTPSGLTHTTRPPGLLDNSTAESPPDPGGPSRGEDDRPGDAPPPY